MYQLTSIAEGINKLLHPFGEVVIHDIKTNTIAAIYNPISKRESGESSYLEINDYRNATVIGPYEKTNYDGRKLKSVSIVIKNDKNELQYLLCINMDVSVFEQYRSILDHFLATSKNEEQDFLFKSDLNDKINHYIQKYCISHNLSITTLEKEHKQNVTLELKKAGALQEKNAIPYIARILNVSRATIYNYLKENTDD